MQRIIILFFLSFLSLSLSAQQLTERTALSLEFGSYSASLAVPSFQPFHPGGRLGLHYQLNKHPKNSLNQAVYLGYFYHADLQHAVQLYTETSYEFRIGDQWWIRPLSIGGGYFLSLMDISTLRWDAQSQTYTKRFVGSRHHWMISLGSELGFVLPGSIAGLPIEILLAYRLQIQGNFINGTVPILPYSPLMIGLKMPLSNS